MNDSYVGHFQFIPHYWDTPYAVLDELIKNAAEGDVFCEVGCFLGHATCFMMERIDYYSSSLKLYAFDMFGESPDAKYGEGYEGRLMPWGEPLGRWTSRCGDSSVVADEFIRNITSSPARHRLHDWVHIPPAHAGDDFKDGSVSVVYLHYSRQQKHILADIAGWHPKLKMGGTLLVQGENAYAALAEYGIKDSVEVSRSVWRHIKS